MGLTVHDLRLLAGLRLGRVLTLGRQNVLATPADLTRLGLSVPAAFRYGDYLDREPVRTALGIEEVIAADASPYEGAALVHDLNTPIPPAHHGRYDAVIDGGTLEHIFNLPVALASCMRVLRVGGCFFGVNPANNLVGHGFYQFCPELYYRVFSPDNGFRVEILELQESRYPSVELGFVGRRYEPIDPAVMGSRGELVTGRPVMARVVATKVADVEPFTRWPQQSDYSAAWDSSAAGRVASRRPLHTLAHAILPNAIRGTLVGWRQLYLARLGNRRRFRPRR